MATKKKPDDGIAVVYDRFKRNIAAMDSMFVGRSELVKTMALALLSEEHAFFLSPPGTAKTAIIREVAKWLSMKFFAVQMRDDTKPEEVLGMWDLGQLDKGRYVRRWARAASAEILYVNECFKGSSNALNAMLGILHERQVDDEDGYHDVPLYTAFLDSNELPKDKNALRAFFDRILFKLPMDYVSTPDHFRALLKGGNKGVAPEPMSRTDLELLNKYVRSIQLHDTYADELLAIRLFLQVESVTVSDRTWAEACGDLDPYGNARGTPIRASALYRGKKITSALDFLTLENILWCEPTDRPKIRRAVLKATMPDALKCEEILDKAIDAHSAAMQSGTDVSGAIQVVLTGRREIMAMSIEDEIKQPYIDRLLWLNAQLAERTMRV